MEIDKPTLELLDEMGFIENPTKKDSFQIRIENGLAGVTYDAKNPDGYRWAKIGGKFLKHDDLDEKVPILKTFKERRDEIKNKLLNDLGVSQSPKGDQGQDKQTIPPSNMVSIPISSSPVPVEGETILQKHNPIPSIQTSGVKNPPPPTSIQEQQPNPPAASHSKNIFLDEIIPAYEIDICELFGGAGDGKSRVVKKIAEDALERGMKVRYIDTERGFLKSDLRKLGESYQYIPNLKGVFDLVRNMPKGIDLFILDSIGYPVLTEWAKMPVNERGNALIQIIAIKDFIKDWAISNNKVAIIINQPDSDFGKGEGYINRPFGDKGQFVIKEVFLIKRTSSTTSMTKSVIESFRSRHDARGIRIAEVEITNDGVKII